MKAKQSEGPNDLVLQELGLVSYARLLGWPVEDVVVAAAGLAVAIAGRNLLIDTPIGFLPVQPINLVLPSEEPAAANLFGGLCSIVQTFQDNLVRNSLSYDASIIYSLTKGSVGKPSGKKVSAADNTLFENLAHKLESVGRDLREDAVCERCSIAGELMLHPRVLVRIGQKACSLPALVSDCHEQFALLIADSFSGYGKNFKSRIEDFTALIETSEAVTNHERGDWRSPTARCVMFLNRRQREELVDTAFYGRVLCMCPILPWSGAAVEVGTNSSFIDWYNDMLQSLLQTRRERKRSFIRFDSDSNCVKFYTQLKRFESECMGAPKDLGRAASGLPASVFMLLQLLSQRSLVGWHDEKDLVSLAFSISRIVLNRHQTAVCGILRKATVERITKEANELIESLENLEESKTVYFSEITEKCNAKKRSRAKVLLDAMESLGVVVRAAARPGAKAYVLGNVPMKDVWDELLNIATMNIIDGE